MGNIEAIVLHQDVTARTSVLPINPLIVIGGADVISDYNKKLDRKIKVYNRRLKALSSPYFLRTMHTASGYEYPGRYFYKKVWDEESGKIREVYIGLTVPDDDSVPKGGFPTPPVNVLEGFTYRVIYHDIICSREVFNCYFRFFEGKQVVALRLQI